MNIVIPLISPDTYIHEQTLPSTLWRIQHHLDKYPSITVVDSAGTVNYGSYNYVDRNVVELSFSGAFAGRAYLN